MVKITRFKGIRPEKKYINKVPTKAYSEYSKNELAFELQSNPYSFLNILKHKKTNKNFNNVKKNIDNFLKRKILVQDEKKSIYIYIQEKQTSIFIGLICGISLQDYGNNNIKIHEKTIKKRELLFAKYLAEVQMYAEPVLVTHENNQVDTLLNDCIQDINHKIYDFNDLDNINHQLWEVPVKYQDDIIHLFSDVNNLYIADGHHRLSSSFINNKHTHCLAYIVSKSQLKTLPFHRVITHQNNTTNILKKITSQLSVSKVDKLNHNMLNMYINQQWYEITFEKQHTNKSINDDLLVNKLSKYILKPIFGIQNERADKLVSFIPGNKPINQLIQNLDCMQVLFLLPPIGINTIIKISKKNKIMPPKSTFILPKIPSGLIMMKICT